MTKPNKAVEIITVGRVLVALDESGSLWRRDMSGAVMEKWEEIGLPEGEWVRLQREHDEKARAIRMQAMSEPPSKDMAEAVDRFEHAQREMYDAISKRKVMKVEA